MARSTVLGWRSARWSHIPPLAGSVYRSTRRPGRSARSRKIAPSIDIRSPERSATIACTLARTSGDEKPFRAQDEPVRGRGCRRRRLAQMRQRERQLDGPAAGMNASRRLAQRYVVAGADADSRRKQGGIIEADEHVDALHPIRRQAQCCAAAPVDLTLQSVAPRPPDWPRAIFVSRYPAAVAAWSSSPTPDRRATDYA